MAKKSKKQKFNNPFSDLKGFSVPVAPDCKPSAEVPQSSFENGPEEDFSSAMDSLGVRKLSKDIERLAHPDPPPQDSVPVTESVRTESDEFLTALGEMDIRFEDEFPVAIESESPARRIRQLRRGKILIDGEIDLHGLTRVAAIEKFNFSLQNARFQGWRTLLVITGQGLHSSEGPVIRDAIEDLLRRDLPTEVLEWSRAPQRHGGQGALILFLRQSS